MAKKRDASTELLQRLHGDMREHNVDFIGGDFNMSAFSTVGDVFTDVEFSAPGNSLLWGLGALEEPNRECAGFLIMPKRPYQWRVHAHGCYKFDNATLGLGPSRPICSSPCSFFFAVLICPDPAASCIVSKHNKEDLSADTTKNVCRDDVHDRAPVHQGLVSVSFTTLLRSLVSLFASLLFLTSALTHGRFDSSLGLPLCLLTVFVSRSVRLDRTLNSVREIMGSDLFSLVGKGCQGQFQSLVDAFGWVVANLLFQGFLCGR